jgi:hypothetical protein
MSSFQYFPARYNGGNGPKRFTICAMKARRVEVPEARRGKLRSGGEWDWGGDDGNDGCFRRDGRGDS